MPLINIGIDEVGRGAWAGPLVLAAYFVIPGKRFFARGCIVRDSKQMSRKQREESNNHLQSVGIYDIQTVSAHEIDSMGIQNAFKQGLLSLSDRITAMASHYGEYKIWIDGRRVIDLPYVHEYIIKGDSIMKIISAASIIAKVFRDTYMMGLAKQFPFYSFEKSVGYGTKEHKNAININGICVEHRKSFAPIRNFIDESSML